MLLGAVNSAALILMYIFFCYESHPSLNFHPTDIDHTNFFYKKYFICTFNDKKVSKLCGGGFVSMCVYVSVLRVTRSVRVGGIQMLTFAYGLV